MRKMQNTPHFGRKTSLKKNNIKVDVDALVDEVLWRIALQVPGSVAHGSPTQQTRSESKGNVPCLTTAAGERTRTSFSGLPQFEYCSSTEDRSLLTYRYLKANNFNLEDTVAMIVDANKFRKQHRLDSIMIFPSLIPLRGFNEKEICTALQLPMATQIPRDPCSSQITFVRDIQVEYLNNHSILKPILSLINRHYPNSIHYWDKDGHPVMYGRLGHINFKELFRELGRISPLHQRPEDLIVLFHIYGNELLWKVLQYCGFKSRPPGKTTKIEWDKWNQTMTVVMDLKGAHIFDFLRGPFRKTIRGLLNLDQRYYPEILHKLVLVNCPKSVAFARWFSKFLISGKRGLWQKVMCVSEENTASVLKTLIDEDKIPYFLGGKCKCKEGCVPLNKIFGNGSLNFFCSSNDTLRVLSKTGSEGRFGESFFEGPNAGSCRLGFPTPKETENVVVMSRRKLTLTYEIRAFEDVTWEFAVKRGKIGFRAVFVACSADGHTQVLMPLTTVAEAADHFFPSTAGELILTWDNTQSFFTARKLQLRVHSRAQGVNTQTSVNVPG
ncbi:hypothetical protein TraAM80_00845 [Trypanosoma rangeli]|uniref:CRAL-TRIO domain-containing protein n=1 Tax=Trypanosoma rangeli TaxID=5698 RepID=A0A3R7MUL5_TRYRA|nr:uncharacterized protein TraAM80_00845 [Trypanosoma rangeli]RNF11518.1 hypothetical protein TraAM80_00845 [Trypanosoma rangeli]|eukprot:RNF11518.1 hypothetical protein TraAM80_00845 [Trypanosoma rangeli]